MLNKVILFFCIITYTLVSPATKPKIVTSITPVASIIAMLTGDMVDITIINPPNASTHHYHGRPTDRQKILDANLVIYIDDSFESVIPKLLVSHTDPIFKISSLDKIKWHDMQAKRNWHFWLDLNNVIILQKELVKQLTLQFPDLKDIIEYNLTQSEIMIHDLIHKKQKLGRIKPIILLNHSLEHFITDIQSEITRMDHLHHPSLKSVKQLEDITNTSNTHCIIIDINQNPNSYTRYNQTIIQLNSENWMEQNQDKLQNLFYKRYIEMIDQLAKCMY